MITIHHTLYIKIWIVVAIYYVSISHSLLIKFFFFLIFSNQKIAIVFYKGFKKVLIQFYGCLF